MKIIVLTIVLALLEGVTCMIAVGIDPRGSGALMALLALVEVLSYAWVAIYLILALLISLGVGQEDYIQK